MSDAYYAKRLNSPGYIFFTKTSFGLAVTATLVGIFMLPTGLWVEGYLAMGSLFLLDATFTLPKTIPDEFEAKTPVNKSTRRVRTGSSRDTNPISHPEVKPGTAARQVGRPREPSSRAQAQQ